MKGKEETLRSSKESTGIETGLWKALMGSRRCNRYIYMYVLGTLKKKNLYRRLDTQLNNVVIVRIVNENYYASICEGNVDPPNKYTC